MKYGVNALIWTASFELEHLPLLPRIRERGFDGVEIPIFHPASTPVAAIRAGLEASGLEVTTCSVIPGGLSVFDVDPGVRAKALDHLKLCIETTAALGGALLAGPVYSPVGWLPGRRRTADEWARAAESLAALDGTLAACGVKLAIEPLNRFETFFLNTAADAAELCHAIGSPNVGILFDTFHANIEEKRLGDALRACGRHLFHVHTCENDRGAPGSGHVPWAEVFQALRDLNYDGWLTIESFGYNIADIAAAAAIWRDLAPLPEDIAFDGLPFLKSAIRG
ncbi:MAG: sugar phosphate isomerase/epimerase [Acidobacteria bacterium]|nr:sugar phosphate isomerase/epimerase [Acidobacteriota bacterium]